MRAALAAALVLALIPAAADAAPRLTKVGDFAEPVHVAGPPGDPSRLFVVEKAGRVQVLVAGVRAAVPFLDLDASVDATGERGLLSIAFAPDYATSGLFYVFYTANDGTLTVREGRRSADPQRGTLGRTLFTIPHPATNHNGGQLAFGPDGRLYVSTGDGATSSNAQDLGSRLGKVLRLDPRVTTTPEIWAYGLRNPWRFSFDRATGAMVIGDVGEGTNEEIDVAPATGGNFGWSTCEGTNPTPCPLAGAVAPVLNLPHTDGYSAVIGGFVVRDPGLPTLLGRYLFGDQSKGTLLSAALGSDTVPRAEGTLPVSAPTSLGEDACGHVYVAQGGGAVSRIDDVAGAPCASGPGVAPPVAPAAPGGTGRARLRAAGPRAADPARRAPEAAAPRAPGVQRDAAGARLPRAARHGPGRPGAGRADHADPQAAAPARAGRPGQARADHRPHPRRGRQARGAAGPGARPLTAKGGGATLLVAPPPLSESFRAPSLGSGP